MLIVFSILYDDVADDDDDENADKVDDEDADDDDVDERTLLMRDCQGWQSEARAYQGAAITCLAAFSCIRHCKMHHTVKCIQCKHHKMRHSMIWML